jgi:hypothetical protein
MVEHLGLLEPELVRRLLLGEHAMHLVLLVRVPVLEHREEQVVLAREVRVDGSFGVSGPLGDLVQRGRMEAAREEDRPGGCDQVAAGAHLALAAGRRIGLDRHQIPSVL